MPIEMLSGFTANISMETQIQQNRRYTTIQLDIIHTGDCLEILKTLPEDSVHCCVTSPPYYALRDYGMDAQIGRETILLALKTNLGDESSNPPFLHSHLSTAFKSTS